MISQKPEQPQAYHCPNCGRDRVPRLIKDGKPRFDQCECGRKSAKVKGVQDAKA